MSKKQKYIVLAAFIAMVFTLSLGHGATSAAASVFVNEFHYDNASTDTGEAIEIAGPAGTDLAGWSLVLYNGNNGATYDTITLSGVIVDQQSGFGALSFPAAGLQNGAPDGFALIDPANNVIQFLSYEGTFAAVDGPAAGMTSTDVGVSEASSTPIGESLQLTGTGSMAEDFTWAGPTASTFGAVNTGQTFTGGTPSDPEVLLTELVVAPTAGEFVEIYNPTSSIIDLSNFYLTDATFAGGSTYYYNIVTGANAGGGGFGDFHARFPDGAAINPGEYQTVALAGSNGYFATYGVNPTYELFEDGTSTDSIADMREALPGSIAGQGGLSNDGEVVILFYWDGASDLVLDMDYAVWGDKAEAVDKTGVSIDGPDADTDTSAYLAETAIASQDIIAAAAHGFDNSWQRDSLTEGAEISTGGNGANGEDETSEDLSNTWCENPPTPGEANDCTPPPPPPGTWIINEINADPDAALGDANGDGIVNTTEDEFVEIYNNSGSDTDISGWTLADGFSVRHTFPADTIVPNGCAVVVFAGGTPAGSFGGSVVQTASTGQLGLNNTGDTITLNDSVNNLAVQDYGSEGNNNQSLTLDPDVTGTPPLVKHSTVTLANGALFSPGTKVDGTVFSDNCAGATETKIHEIQGNGLASPLVGQEVIIEGIVVGDFQAVGQFGGFHVQEEDADVDGDPATSEGIFVFHFSTDVNVGDMVQVTGTVAEFNGLTEITDVSNVTMIGSGGSVTPTAVSLPFANLDDLEAYEGMLVTFPQDLYISEYFNFDRFNETVLTAERQFQPTATFDPGSPEAAAMAAANSLSRIILDDGRSTQNSDPALHPNGAEFTITNTFRGGDVLQNVTGVIDYAFGSYKIQPTQGAVHVPQNPRTDMPDDVGGTLKVASFNVLNYFSTIDTGASICGPAGNLGCRGADTPEEFQRQRDKIFSALAAIDADVVGLIEIENHATDAALQDLVTGLNAALGSEIYGYIATGPIGSDAIKVAFIYKLAAVEPVGDYAILDSAVDGRFLDTKNRPALAQTFTDSQTNGQVTVVVNHLKSKSSACDDVGDPDLGDGAGNCNVTRTMAAQALVDWLATDPTSSGDPDFLIIGDLNSYDKEDPIDAILAGADDVLGSSDDYTDLLYDFIGENAYSYVFDGQLGYLDHGLANADLLPQVTGITAWHINADEPDIIDYDMTFKQDAQDALWEPHAYRSSDHDPVVIGLQLESAGPGSTDVLYVSGSSYGNAGGVTFANEDIMAYDMATGQWSMYFDGSDLKLWGVDIDAVHVLEDGSILMSFSQRFKIRGFGKVDDSDIIKFNPTSLGENTDGNFEWFFDGSDVGLSRNGEDVDGIGFTPDGRLVISVTSSFRVRQTGGGTVRGYDDDLIVFNDTRLGKHTRGNWEKYFDGSDVWHHSEDIGGLWLDAATGDIYLSMKSEFTAGSVNGNELDIFICHPVSLGHDTACTFGPGLYFSGSATGFMNDKIDGFSIVKQPE